MDPVLSIEELHKIQYELILQFDKFCEENGYRYYLFYGTLLGAIRHKGFIPWDDDVDIAMPRPDYEKLIQAKQLSDTAFIVTNRNPHSYYHPFTYCNITDTRTIMEENQMKKPTGKGVFIDIFPLDGLPDNDRDVYKHLKKALLLKKMLVYSHMAKPPINSIKNFLKVILCILASTFNPEKLIAKIDKLAQRYDFDKSTKVANVVFVEPDFEKEIHMREDFGAGLKTKFVDRELRVPNNYEDILRRCYGDYMTPPPLNEQHGHHEIFYRWKKGIEHR